MDTAALTTPALLVDAGRLEDKSRTMADALPGDRLRPHVKAHKCTALAATPGAAGHAGFTCATMREMEGMARAGLGDDLLLANEVADATRLGALARAGARVTVAVDSEATIDAAARAGVPEVLIDVNVGLPRCGCRPEDAGRLADRARAAGLRVRGVMGYEGHIVGLEDRATRAAMIEVSMAQLALAAAEVGGDVVSAGGTGTYDLNTLGDRDPGRLLRPDGHRLRQAGPALRPGALGPGHRDLGLGRAGPSPTAGSRRSAWTTATLPSRAPRCGSAPTST